MDQVMTEALLGMVCLFSWTWYAGTRPHHYFRRRHYGYSTHLTN